MACKPGFFGKLCNSSCPPGAFGKNCGGVCWNCSVEDCDPGYGCFKTKKTTYQGVIHNSNNQSENAWSIFGTSTANNYEGQSSFKTVYLLHGLNGVLCLFLFAFIFHRCIKSYLSKRTYGNCMTHDKSNVQDEFHMQDQQGSRKSYDTISDSAIIVENCRSMESEYDEIDVKLQIDNLQLSQTFLDDYEGQNFSSKYLLCTGSDLPIKDVQVEHDLESSTS